MENRNSRFTGLEVVIGSFITRKTDYLICGEKVGSKLMHINR